MVKSKLNGYEVEHNGKEWVFSDNKESTIATHKDRPCGNCLKFPIKEGTESYDACIGKVKGLMNACCGHGCEKEAYAQLEGGLILQGRDAVNYFKENS
jgi:hypothetical protein